MTSFRCSAVPPERVIHASQDYLGLNDVAPCEIILRVDPGQLPALSPFPLCRLESLAWHFFFPLGIFEYSHRDHETAQALCKHGEILTRGQERVLGGMGKAISGS